MAEQGAGTCTMTAILLYYGVQMTDRGVAQLVARGVWDAEVGGSSPLTPTGFVAGVTQLAECRPSKPVVAGSNPVSRSEIRIVTILLSAVS